MPLDKKNYHYTLEEGSSAVDSENMLCTFALVIGHIYPKFKSKHLNHEY